MLREGVIVTSVLRKHFATVGTLIGIVGVFGSTLLLPLDLRAGVFADLPDVLVCSVDDPSNEQRWDQFVFYVSAKLDDGAVLYKSLTSNPVLVKISPDGTVSAENLADCDSKTVTELRDEGRAFDF